MPIYAYQCTECDNHFEELVSATGGTLIACPTCSSTDVSKLLSQFQRSRGGGDMPAMAAASAPRAGGGGCCGGGCGCGGH